MESIAGICRFSHEQRLAAGQGQVHTGGSDLGDTSMGHSAVQLEAAASTQHLQSTLEQLTERKRLLRSILDGIPGMVAYWDHDLRNRFCNRAFLAWLGADQDITGQHLRDVIGEEVFFQDRQQIESTLLGQAQQFERTLHGAGKQGVLHAQVHLVPDMVDGQVKGFFAMVFDITKIKSAEGKAEAASQAKSEFLASMSHEIRTPLHAVLGLAQVGERATTDPRAAQTFKDILESGQHLLALVNDVLDFSKIEAGKIVLEADRVDLGQVIEQAMNMVAARAQAKGLELRMEQGPAVPHSFKGDELRITQLLINLLSNAVKFTEQGQVTLRVDSQDNWLVLQVRDTGMGMSPEVQSHLFQPFVQGDGTSTRCIGGTGLGLSICKRLLDIMDGDIHVQSAPGQGSTFEIRLPLFGAQPGDQPLRHIDTRQTQPGLQLPTGPRLNGLRVLVAEDHPVNQMVLKDLLSTEGAIITCVDNGALAVDEVRAGQVFDVMLCDIEMPVMDGYEATRQIKALSPGLPIIGLTAHAFDVARQQGMAAGMTDYLTKPYMIDQLVKNIARHALKPLAEVASPPSPAASFQIDRQALINHYPQGAQFIDRLFVTIRDTSLTLPQQLREAATQRDAERLRALAHNTKGMAANLLVNDLRWLASHLEDQCRQDPQAAFTSAGALASAVEAMIASLGLG
ncbi:MAG: PAS domain-containing sensor histidine kinase [Rubrivivax sp.]|nr:MAG: PAS domain-containing sensor histidine kinase [Rubrivivax sp.]